MRRSLPLDFEPRAVCSRCTRPVRVCYCAHLTSIETRTRVVLLQHPREEGMPIGTAHMARLCLSNSELHVGVDFRASPALRRALEDPARPAALLYPSDGAVDVLADPPRGPITLVVVDGTWSQAKKLVRSNPDIARLPRYAFRAPTPSEYRIRREPDEAYVSTLEALVHVLGVLEGEPDKVRALLAPFHAMIDKQVEFATAAHAPRVRHVRRRPQPRPLPIPPVLGARRADVVCVTGDANAWPYDRGELRASHEDELVHWVAHRPATGETLDLIVRPRSPLAPNTPVHLGLTADALMNGVSVPELLERWRAFTRDDDVVCSWGHYAARVFGAVGGELPKTRLDLRQVSRDLLCGRVGTMEAVLAGLAVDPTSLAAVGRGRAGARAAQLARIAAHFAERLQGAVQCLRTPA